jgi:hypothetical protein
MRREQQSHDAQSRLGAQSGKHVGESRDSGVGDFHVYISTVVEI